MNNKVAIIDDDTALAAVLKEFYQEEGYEAQVYTEGLPALEALSASPVELVVCDLKLPDIDGLHLMERLRERGVDAPLLLVTAHGSVETAVQALERGAYDYVTKPINFTELAVLSSRALHLKRLERDYQALSAGLRQSASFEGIVGKSRRMQQVFDLIERVARTASTVLITGESGTGKERVARAIHSRSSRAKRPFLAVNCSAIPETLLESELFGHKKGSFTGASESRKGLFEEAEGGTLLLDEIGDMPLSLQSKLLRVLQERSVKPVGDNTPRPIDVRILTATHKDLKAMIREGTFREDLYYRLAVIPIHVPPLRERREDIPLLTEHILERLSRQAGGRTLRCTRAGMTKLLRLQWSGNVRELENALERAGVLCRNGTIDEPDITTESGGGPDLAVGELFSRLPTIAELERQYIEYVLTRTNGRKEESAQILGVNRKTLYRKEREYGLTPGNGAPDPGDGPSPQ